MKPTDLVSIQEIAEMDDVGISAINQWEKRTYLSFPTPWGVWPGRHRLWLRADIEDWFAEREAQENDRKLDKIKKLKAEIKRLESNA